MDATDLHYAHMLKKHCKYPECKGCIFGKEFINMDHKAFYQCFIWTLPDKEDK